MNLIEKRANRKRILVVGFTLVEMMVALTIALVLTVVALPRVKDGLKQNVSTRTATMVKATFENARAQAIRTGRPFGVVLHRAQSSIVQSAGLNDPANLNDPIYNPSHGANYCNRVSFVQTAFYYRGDVENATGTIVYEQLRGTGEIRPTLVCSSGVAGLLLAIAQGNIPAKDSPIREGGRVDIDGVAGALEIVAPQFAALSDPPGSPPPPAIEARAGGNVRVWLSSRTPAIAARTRWVNGDVVSFRFETHPMPSPMADVTLPGKAVIDLTCSGIGRDVWAFAPRSIVDANDLAAATGNALNEYPYAPGFVPRQGVNPEYGFHDVIVMFNGSGQLDSVYLDQYLDSSGTDNTTQSDDYRYRRIPVASPIALLIAEADGVVLPESIAITPLRPATVLPAAVPQTYQPRPDVSPNFSNTDNAWLTILPMSGVTDLSLVASPLKSAGSETAFFDSHPECLQASGPDASDFIRARILDSRRLARGTIR